MSLVTINFAGRSFRLENYGGADQVARQMEQGSYEPPLPFLMMATLLRMDGDFLDVGANTGVYSILAGVLAPDRHVISFEPHPKIVEVLKTNLKANDLEGRVSLYELGLSNEAGSATLYMPDQGHGLLETSASLEKDFQAVADSMQIKIARLDDLEIENQIAVVKVDIEGHEPAFLQGATQLLQRDRPIVFAEVLHHAKRPVLNRILRENTYIDFRLRADMAIHDGEVLFDDAAWNHAFVPIERLDKFREACESCKLPMLRRFVTRY